MTFRISKSKYDSTSSRERGRRIRRNPQPPGGGGGGRVTPTEMRPQQILMHFEKVDLDKLAINPEFFGKFNGFVYHHMGHQETTVQDQIARGRKHFAYYNVWNFPLTTSVGQGHLWLDWFQANVQLAGPVARMIGSLGEIGLFRYFYNSITCEHPEIVDWAKINAANQLVILTKMLDLRPNSGLFFDQAWRAPVSGYFCDPNTDVGQQCRPCATGLAYADYLTGATWTTNILNFYTLAKAACEARGLYLIKNGAAADFTTNGEHPIYIENADNFAVSGKTFDQWVTIWRQHPKNVLSVIVPTAYPGAPGSGTNQAVDRVCAAYRQYGGWVAFTGEIAQHSSITAAYAAIQAIGGGV